MTVGFPQWRTSRRVDSGQRRGRKGQGWRIETLREVFGSVSGRLGMAGACLHLEDGALQLYAGAPRRWAGGGSSVEKVQRPLGLTILGRFRSLWGDNIMSQQPKLEMIPEHRVASNVNLGGKKKKQAPCPGFQWNSQRRMWKLAREPVGLCTKRESVEVRFSKTWQKDLAKESPLCRRDGSQGPADQQKQE